MYIQKATLCMKSTKQTKNFKERNKLEKKTIKKINYKIGENKGTKGKNQSPSPRPVKQRSSKESKQLIFETIQILKSLPIAFLPETTQ